MNNFRIKNKNEINKLMELSLTTGKYMLENGAETYRVEDTMIRICNSRNNIKNVDSFVTQTGIFITLEYDNQVFSNFRRVKSIEINLNKIHEINEFSRTFVNNHISIEDGIKTVEKINNKKGYSDITKIISASSAAAFFCLLFGGNLKDFISSFLLSIIVVKVLLQILKYEFTFFLNNLIGAFLISFLAYFTVRIGIGDNIDKIIIGSIMYLVPGVAITNAIRDTMSGDSLTGLSRGLEAVFSALSIAAGVGIVLNLYMKGVI